ncbi:sensor domain-containing diguanylate cyclase [Acuticoccus sediminis]|uniref:sensor domain-containing diguanylate cyclase n=1 Tax=Acuticoccus sediminis TaxID=2184697 RepID=UPI001CFEB0EF|nr:sensor domain-containing diguanylate cyclase [Acuticoccus sediminis]
MDIGQEGGFARRRVEPWKPFWLIFPVLAGAILVISWFITDWRIERSVALITLNEKDAVTRYVELVSRRLRQASIDVCAFSRQNELHQYLENDDRAFLSEGAKEFVTRMLLSRTYDHMRFIDMEGEERVRVNFNGGNPVIVSERNLQVKSNRYYFSELFNTKRGDVYISSIDLNIENGNIELPHKPVMRFGAPVFDDSGVQRGFFLINVLARPILDAMIEQGLLHDGNPMLLNEDGYWLVDPTMPASWGFLYPAFVDERMPVIYPAEWAIMQVAPSGSFRSSNGIFTYARYHPLDEVEQCEPSEPESATGPQTYHWFLASHVPASDLRSVAWRIRRQVAASAFLLMALGGVGTRAATVKLAERRRWRRMLEQRAIRDILTGLSNRAAFEDRFREEISRADRQKTKLAVVLADLDGFKAINDNLGHRAGDRVLRRVANILQDACRSTDMAARLGGDEFAMLLSGIADTQGAKRVADAALARIQSLREGTFHVGASFGIAIYPDDSADPNEIVALADRAMYAAKNDGKNCTRTASELTV